MILETKRFILRMVSPKDEKSIFEILKDSKVRKYLNIPEIKSICDVSSLIQDYINGYNAGTKYPFAICDKESNCFLGVFLLKEDTFDDDCYEYTVYIAKDHWNKGIYSEVLPEMIRYAFEVINTGNFRGFVMKNNSASVHVLINNEFIFEKAFFVPGIEELIESYLMTKDYYYNNYKNSRFIC